MVYLHSASDLFAHKLQLIVINLRHRRRTQNAAAQPHRHQNIVHNAAGAQIIAVPMHSSELRCAVLKRSGCRYDSALRVAAAFGNHRPHIVHCTHTRAIASGLRAAPNPQRSRTSADVNWQTCSPGGRINRKRDARTRVLLPCLPQTNTPTPYHNPSAIIAHEPACTIPGAVYARTCRSFGAGQTGVMGLRAPILSLSRNRSRKLLSVLLVKRVQDVPENCERFLI